MAAACVSAFGKESVLTKTVPFTELDAGRKLFATHEFAHKRREFTLSAFSFSVDAATTYEEESCKLSTALSHRRHGLSS